jgi:hypothetical protein
MAVPVHKHLVKLHSFLIKFGCRQMWPPSTSGLEMVVKREIPSPCNETKKIVEYKRSHEFDLIFYI